MIEMIVKKKAKSREKTFRVHYRPQGDNPRSGNLTAIIDATSANKAKQKVKEMYPDCKVTAAWRVDIIR
ncbi:MAG: hypothetical protein SFH39_00215 [Candidatus Magnetobacterium sp. LHC-1]